MGVPSPSEFTSDRKNLDAADKILREKARLIIQDVCSLYNRKPLEDLDRISQQKESVEHFLRLIELQHAWVSLVHARTYIFECILEECHRE